MAQDEILGKQLITRLYSSINRSTPSSPPQSVPNFRVPVAGHACYTFLAMNVAIWSHGDRYDSSACRRAV